ncbi:MAG: hypothetical protein ACRC6E_07560, partial [Fusobacteriaceae bacterium]
EGGNLMSMMVAQVAMASFQAVNTLISNRSQGKIAGIQNETAHFQASKNKDLAIKNQLKSFENFAKEQQKGIGSQNVAVAFSGMSRKSSVVESMGRENRTDYYDTAQSLKENIDTIKEQENIDKLNAQINYRNIKAQLHKSNVDTLVKFGMDAYSATSSAKANANAIGSIDADMASVNDSSMRYSREIGRLNLNNNLNQGNTNLDFRKNAFGYSY